jgi:hypothetical protein
LAWLAHGSIFSKIGASTKSGAVHFFLKPFDDATEMGYGSASTSRFASKTLPDVNFTPGRSATSAERRDA